MTIKLKISPDLSLPLEFITSTQGILAKKRVGKSYTAMVEAEELLEAGQQVVVLDPTGAWWGLRSSADGKAPGYPITIFGGDHGDIQLEATAGATLAEAIAADRFSAVIDLTCFRKGERLRFAADFLETLYRLNREAMHLFIDEADVFAPQRTFTPEQARCLGATDELVRRGGIRGIGVTLISQRAQVVNKDVLSQIDQLVVLRMNHPKDIGSIRDWIVEYVDAGTAKEMLASLPALPMGTAWIWSPAGETFQRVAIRQKRTFDSGKTPKAGERRVEPKVLAKVDLDRLGKAMAESVERTKANDPKALRARVAELEKQLAAKRAPAPAKAETKVIEKPVIKDAQIARIEKLLDKAGDTREGLVRSMELLDYAAKELRAVANAALAPAPTNRAIAAAHFANDGKVTVLTGKHQIRVPAQEARAVERRVYPSSQAATVRSLVPGSIPVGEAATLRAVIQYTSGLRREQLTVLTGYKRSTRDAYIARLREKGLVEVQADRVLVTREGVQAMPDAEPLPTGRALQEFWMQRLPAGEAAILTPLLNARGAELAREALSEQTGYKRSTRDAYLSRLAAKELVVDVGRGFVRASETLFEVGS